MITEYCSKGSLEDLAHNDNVHLDWMFKLSLVIDVAKVCWSFIGPLQSLELFWQIGRSPTGYKPVISRLYLTSLFKVKINKK